MVRRVHKYADGGKIVRDHSNDTSYVYPKPSYADAVKDRVKGFFTKGAAKKASDEVTGRQKQLDKQIDSMDH